jgi:hypothetical protein
MGSKEGSRALVSDGNQEIFIHGGRGIEAIKRLQNFDPLKNEFTTANDTCP